MDENKFLEMASAAALCTPAMCSPTMSKMHRKQRSRCISRAEWLRSTSTTAMLSVRNRMQLPCQWGPHNAAAITIGTNSLAAMSVLAAALGK